MALNLTLEFSGGAELLVDKQKVHKVEIATAGKTWKIQVCIETRTIIYRKKNFGHFYWIMERKRS